jgi:hypothetical protein
MEQRTTEECGRAMCRTDSCILSGRLLLKELEGEMVEGRFLIRWLGVVRYVAGGDRGCGREKCV